VHACCGHTHTTIDSALALRAQPGWTEGDASARVDVLGIEIYGPGFDVVKEMNPRSAYQAKFSLAYCAAVALLEGKVGLDQFASDRFCAGGVRDPVIASLLQRTRVSVAADLSAKYPAAWPARLRIRLVDGTVLTCAADYPRGNPENPVTTQELEAKFRLLASPRYGPEVTARALTAVQTLPGCDDLALVFPAVLSGWSQRVEDVLAATPHG
jgi:2-methylcitrate dehydratase PrpD